MTHLPSEPGSQPESTLAPMVNAKADEHTTAGFVIPGIKDLLNDSLNTAGDLLGWMFLFPDGDPSENAMNSIRIKQLWKSTQGGNIVIYLTDFIPSGRIQPKICRQAVRTSSIQHTIDYSPALSLTNTVFSDPSQDLKIDALTYHRSWAEAAFLRRSDLNFLRDYLSEASGLGYNDVFFSGSEVQFGTMHNPRLRVQQHNYRPNGSPLPLYDTAHAFTLKAEPFIAGGTPSSTTPNSQGGISGSGATTGQTGNTNPPPQVVQTAKAPGAFMMIPCPDFWDIIHETAMEMAANDIWFGQSLVPEISKSISPDDYRSILNSPQSIQVADANILVSVASWIRNVVGNTPDPDNSDG